MSETSKGLVDSSGLSRMGPDYFSFYSQEVNDLLVKCEGIMPFETVLAESQSGEVKPKGSAPLFEDSISATLSDLRKERLNALLRQAVEALSPEVDEMLDPIVNMRRLKSQVSSKKIVPDNTGEAVKDDPVQVPNKKIKMASSLSSPSITASELASTSASSEFLDVGLPGKEAARNDVRKHCARCSTSNTSDWVVGPEGKFLCSSCGIGAKNGSEPCVASTQSSQKGISEEEDDLQFLLVNDCSIVEETIKKYSDELFNTLDHMEKHLEKLLNTVMSTCRPMTLVEKRKLQRLIQELPPKNLDRVVEIIQSRKPVENQPSGEIFVDLELEDNITLWRLYYYVEAVEKARVLSMMFPTDAKKLQG